MDWSSLVLNPVLNAFAIPATFTPIASQPGAPAFQGRGVWSVKHQEFVLEGEGRLSDRTLTLGIRTAEFKVPPAQMDQVTLVASDQVTAPGVAAGTPLDFVIDDYQPDGQGGATLVLKRLRP